MALLGIPLGIGALFVELNGTSGLVSARVPEQGLGVWAKKKEKGESFINGDFRLSMDAYLFIEDIPLPGLKSTLRYLAPQLINKIFLGKGAFTPSIIQQNLSSISRLAFPLPTKSDKLNGIFDKQIEMFICVSKGFIHFAC